MDPQQLPTIRPRAIPARPAVFPSRRNSSEIAGELFVGAVLAPLEHTHKAT